MVARSGLLLLPVLLAGSSLAFLFGSSKPAVDPQWQNYHNQEQLEAKLKEINKRCPEITTLYEIGQSAQGRPLVVIQFSTSPGEHVANKPEAKYVGNMHGNEPVGRELLLRLADYLCQAAIDKDHDVLQLLNSTSIHLLPTMNPDGFELALATPSAERKWLTGRANANGVDLNRDFPDLDGVFFELEKMQVPKFDHLLGLFGEDQTERQPETLAVGHWILPLPFVVSANLHEGDLVANYPFDAAPEEGVSRYSESPDDGTFRWLAETYAENHAHMAKNDHPPCDGSRQDAFATQGGITNGAKWYSVSGGMQDFNYLATNAMEITLELSCEKMPSGSSLPQLWEDNKKSLVEYLWKAHAGVKGTVFDAETGHPLHRAVVWVRNGTQIIRHPVTTWIHGDYYRVLPAGTYELLVSAPGYEAEMRNVTIENKVRDSALVVDFGLKPVIVEQELPEDEPMTREQIASIIEELRGEQEEDN